MDKVQIQLWPSIMLKTEGDVEELDYQVSATDRTVIVRDDGDIGAMLDRAFEAGRMFAGSQQDELPEIRQTDDCQTVVDDEKLKHFGFAFTDYCDSSDKRVEIRASRKPRLMIRRAFEAGCHFPEYPTFT